MSTYLGWTIVTMPASPPAPASIEFTQVDVVALNKSPFTLQQQVQVWSGKQMLASVSMPPLRKTEAQAWVAFLRNLTGRANVFKFGDAFRAAYAADLDYGDGSPRYWRLISNERKWSITAQRVYGVQFEIEEAI